MKNLFPLAAVFFVFFVFSSTLAAQDYIIPCQKDNFDHFIQQFAELDKNAQMAYVQSSLVEKYDENCKRKTRRAVIEHINGWSYIIPNKTVRESEKISFKTSMENSKGIVSLNKNATWLYGRLEFSWQGDCWRLSSFQFDMADPNECASSK